MINATFALCRLLRKTALIALLLHTSSLMAQQSNAEVAKIAASIPDFPVAHRATPDLPAAATGNLTADLSPAQIRKALKLVADWQIANPPQASVIAKLTGKTDPRQWTYGTFYLGLLAWAMQSHDPHYMDFLQGQAALNQWKMIEDVYHADGHLVGSLYMALGEMNNNPAAFAEIKTAFDAILANPSNYTSMDFPVPDLQTLLKGHEGLQRWTWADALFMAPAVWMQLSNITGDPRYREFAIREFWVTHDKLYDPDESLYYRDSRFIGMRDQHGGKIFWSRGNGWVFAGLALLLEQLPVTHPSRPKFEEIFLAMAERLSQLQASDGYWRSSLIDPKSLSSPESSGTALNTFAFAWGLNRGLLDSSGYLPVVQRGWQALVQSIHTDGRLGWVQGIGDSPANASFNDTNMFAAGAFLLAGSELLNFPASKSQCRQRKPVLIEVTNHHDSIVLRNHTIELDASHGKAIKRLLACTSKFIAVHDPDTNRPLLSQKLDLDQDLQWETLLIQLDVGAGETRRLELTLQDNPPVADTGGISYGRLVPERSDDFTFENNRVAFRLYGPALQNQGETSSGIDYWGKRVGRNIVNDWYAKPQSRTSNYHIDTGEGADFYKVGSSLGVGGHGLLVDGKLYTPENFSRAKVLAMGPIRLVAELAYDNWPTPDGNIAFTRRITLDRNQHLMQTELLFNEPFSSGGKLVTGLNRQNGVDTEKLWRAEKGIYSLWSDLGERWQQLGTGLYLPWSVVGSSPIIDAEHILLEITRSDDDVYRYYSGACWSKSGYCDNADTWLQYLTSFRLSSSAEPRIRIK